MAKQKWRCNTDERLRDNKKQDWHFFANSNEVWEVSKDVDQLIRNMKRNLGFARSFVVYRIALPIETDYNIPYADSPPSLAEDQICLIGTYTCEPK